MTFHALSVLSFGFETLVALCLNLLHLRPSLSLSAQPLTALAGWLFLPFGSGLFRDHLAALIAPCYLIGSTCLTLPDWY